ncbi:hypothetical protein [Streptosporangium sp. KLBMP 9127]|nr:hypothetical protein [Streptosporangium sp. KLBMP 9127]
MVLVTVRLPPGATIDDARERLGLAEREVDLDYGLVLIDPAEGLYALRVADEAGGRMEGEAGPYADPVIEPYGPVKRSPD